MMAIKRVSALLMLLLVVVCVRAQMNRRVTVTTELESPSSFDALVGGVSASFFCDIDHWSVGAGVQTSNRYPNYFGALMVQAAYMWNRSWGTVAVTNHLGYRCHGANALDDATFTLYAAFKGNHWEAALGNSILWQVNNEVIRKFWLSPVIKLRGMLRPNVSLWNIGVFAKNYDEFILRGFTMMYWGMDGHYCITNRWKVVAEASVMSTGNFSAASNYHGLNFKLGAVYKW